ncbi:valine--tRNA ligase [Candidatus Campbellbacteria bacterium]|nr:MAG: valine--tRNA ligase [Candidatus Campbellbacteria bacterium]
MPHEKFLKPYDPTHTEKETYTKWEKSGYFNPDVCVEKSITSPNATPFSVVLPPPNVTGTLHTGHALMLAIQDTIIRFERMRGKKALWVPGTDHAAIATQSKVEKILEKEGVKKHELGREAFLERVNAFAQESHDTIVGQVRSMGSSIDWSREAFTLDTVRTKAVQTAFVRMYNDGLIYRGHKVVNWDPKGQTVISDDEVVYEERQATMYTFRYSKDFPFAISTTRPETKLGDTAVAVHPDDARYKEYIGKTYNLTFAGAPLSIKIIADESVDPEFGTGALGVTPAHSQIDADIALRHNLSSIQVIDEFAKMVIGNETIKGKKTTEARENVVAWLRTEGLIEKEETVTQNVSKAERSGGIIEPIPKMQWFISVTKPFTLKHSNIPSIASGSETTLKNIMRASVESKAVTVLPERFEKTYFHWIDNLRDWCISRQIWYGHRIPVWYKGSETYVGLEAPTGDGWAQDEDTLDTWFSSGLWTFSTLGWPEETADFKTYHPTALLETGYDILFFWVARMILMSGYLLGDVPFRTVYLHGLVRDEKGRKMSKSLGNIVDPLSLIEKYGADSLRMAMIVAVGPGNDSNLSEEKVKAYKKFGNKMWNMTRFILSNTEDAPTEQPTLTDADNSRIKELDALVQEVTDDMETYRLYLASEKLYHYIWHTFADIILEEAKPALMGEGGHIKQSAQWTLTHILKTSLKLLHPFMPFITEEIWSSLPHTETDMIMVALWPKSSRC